MGIREEQVMKFKHGTRRRALEYEKEWVQRWKADGTFEKSVENRSVDNAYVFYDGPPFITGNPHHGTLLSSIVKDAVPRYWTMKGKRVERVWGWDCHGLPAENFVEKQLNITDRRQIVTSADQAAPLDKDGNELPTVTLEHYITKARESMVANSATWEGTVDRIGRWVDFQGAYKTMDKNFMESVWWAFKTLYEQGKIYEGEKVLMYDTKFATPVSKNEVTMDNDAYQTVTDPSVYVKFKLKDGRTILAWTTTPWTLPGNTALAVNENLDYVEVKIDGDQFILAKDLVEKVLQDEKHRPLEYEVIDALKGKDLVGQCYEPLFEDYYLKPAKDSLGNYVSTELLNSDINGKYDWSPVENAYKIWAADYVSSENGTGIVHLAPIYGEEDFALAVKHNIPRLHVLDDNGYYYPKAAAELYRLMPWVDATKPLEVWESNKNIAKGLEKAGIVWKTEYIRHEYPFNPRSKQRIMYRAIPSWFFDVQGSKPLMLEQNEHINWFPEHLKHGRFAKNIEQAPDWNLSRDRFWATAMPVWKGDKGTVKVVGSYAELKELSGVELDDYHRPWVDDITFEIDGEEFTRIEKVLDCWFESGSMPFAQFHYPFENKEKFEANFPGDFIVEYVGQVRAWFYYVHTVNTALFGENAFKNVITTGVVAGNDGRKMSKSLGNYTDPNELMDKFSADSLRFLLLGSPLLSGEDFALQDKDVSDTARKLSMIWNMYDFFTMYAEVDGWEYDGTLEDPLQSLTNPLDIWIVSRVHQLVTEIEKYMDAYNIPDALSPILPFLDDASNWYVRRSRRRFWKSEDDSDKNDAYKTLHYVLVRLSYVLAPFTPFLAEELYHNLTGDTESIHLKDWLSTGGVDQTVVDSMETTKEAVNLALSIRAQNSVKIRQPLGALHINTANDAHELYLDIIEDEVNVKSVQPINPTASEIKENLIKGMKTPMYGITSNGNVAIAIEGDITPELKREGLMREVVRYVQNARKQAGLNVDDRIVLQLTTTDNELQQAIAEHQTVIKAECLASFGDTDQNSTDVKVDGAELQIALNVQ
ncbi:MAG TPA: isoleucine--tRNA ligase [Candidatus Nanoperiomorbaceae bacterium]|nr:isoleucine--tRNA ligase [Candidatus Nanoperiomorbaceae bacterium]HMQ96888.1 isoleucine--tRNA ligase [Candidatus Nanoperiomorbaceae bacterium]